MRFSYTSVKITGWRSYVFSGCVMLFLSACGGTSGEISPDKPDVDKVAEGKTIFANQCSSCHGSSGDGMGGFPSLHLPHCKSCSDVETLKARIASSMPLNAARCSGTCAEYVSAFIIETFKPVVVQADCDVKSAPVRRVTRFEYSNTIADLFSDYSRPGNDLPSEQLGNGFGNDAAELSVSNLLVERYYSIADRISAEVVEDSNRWEKLHSCVKNVKSSTEQSCAKSVIGDLLVAAYRRPPTNSEIDQHVQLQQTIRKGDSFKGSIAGVISAILQSPEFLYRVEKGEFDYEENKLKPTSYEIASRLSYLFWGTMPDQILLNAAKNGGVIQQRRCARASEAADGSLKIQACYQVLF